MVFFTCDACGESLKKNQVEKHYNQKCRRCSVLTCVDCQQDFPGDSYVTHTSCITEDEKYGGKNYQPKQNANKGLKKQNAWIEDLQNLVSSKASEIDPDVKQVCDTIMTFENIPRKRAKFFNFAKNVLGGGRRASPSTIEKTWELLEQAQKKSKAQDQPAPLQVDSRAKEVEDKPKEVSEEIEEDGGKKEEKKKKSKKDKKRKLEEDTEEKKPVEEEEESKKKKFKKDKKRKAEGDKAPNDEEDQPRRKKCKKNKKNEEETVDGPKGEESGDKENENTSNEGKKFNFEETIVKILSQKGEMKVNKLTKKVVNEYWSQTGEEGVEIGEDKRIKVASKVEKKLEKSKLFKVQKNKVCLAEEQVAQAENKADEHKKESKGSFNQWEQTNLGDDSANEKFRRLMGMGKGTSKPGASQNGNASHLSSVGSKSSYSQMFANQEQEFERARNAAFKQKGAGFGFGSKPKNAITKFE